MTGTLTDKDGTVSPLKILQTEPPAGDKIKAKAQEVRLALLERLGTELKSSSSLLTERLHELAELTSILNALDPGAHGIGSYGALLASAQETAPPSLKLGDVVRVEGADMAVNLISGGPDGDDASRVRVELIPAASSGAGGYSLK